MSSKFLYIVSTPIGNLDDISLRAIKVLKDVNIIACEDTRHSKKLLTHYGIHKELISYHDYNEEKIKNKVINRILLGESVALISDAGTPLISDPGYKLVQIAQENGIKVVPIPGASSILSALVVSSIPTNEFFFGGFLESKLKAKETQIERLKTLKTTTIFFESPNRLLETIKTIEKILGNEIKIAIARELTKLFEEVKVGTPTVLIKWLSEKEVKGEIVIVIEPFKQAEPSILDIENEIKNLLQNEKTQDITQIISEKYSISKRKVYQMVLEFKKPLK